MNRQAAPSSRQKYAHGHIHHTFSLCPGLSWLESQHGDTTKLSHPAAPSGSQAQGLLGKHSEQLPLGRWKGLVTPHSAAELSGQKHSHEHMAR